MKTGRVRTKEQQPEAQAEAPGPPPPVPAKKVNIPSWVWIAVLAVILVAAVAICIAAFGGKAADRWIPVTSTRGEWTTTTTLFGPQVTVQEMWEADCTASSGCTVRAGTCTLKDTDSYQDTVVDEYDEYAFNMYYEETYRQIYEAQGTEFVPAELNTDDWWKDNLHYSLEEELDQETCQYTNYTLWVDDPQDNTQETEVYLSDCEVWDHVTVAERVYEQKAWCQADVPSLVQVAQQSRQGTGTDVRWPEGSVPAGGRSEQSFQGQVTFLGDDYTYTATTQDLAVYQSYMTDAYYIGLRDEKPVAVINNPPQK